MTHDVMPDQALQIGLGFRASKVLLSAVELGVFTVVGRQPAHLATLSRQLRPHERGARDFLGALVSLKLLKREDAIYRNTDETGLFLDRARPSMIVYESYAAVLSPRRLLFLIIDLRDLRDGYCF
jgi:hypothetical protein